MCASRGCERGPEVYSNYRHTTLFTWLPNTDISSARYDQRDCLLRVEKKPFAGKQVLCVRCGYNYRCEASAEKFAEMGLVKNQVVSSSAAMEKNTNSQVFLYSAVRCMYCCTIVGGERVMHRSTAARLFMFFVLVTNAACKCACEVGILQSEGRCS